MCASSRNGWTILKQMLNLSNPYNQTFHDYRVISVQILVGPDIIEITDNGPYMFISESTKMCIESKVELMDNY